MGIRIDYTGNIGNCLFQYTYARLLANRNGFELMTPFPYQQLLKTTPPKNGIRYKTPRTILEEPSFSETLVRTTPASPGNSVKLAMLAFYKHLENQLEPGFYILKGYFECSDLFNKEIEIIKSFFMLDKEALNYNDIVINLRMGDFSNGGFIIDPKWYLHILDKESFDRLYIVGANKEEPCLQIFSHYAPIIVPPHPVHDFHTIRRFDKIICSNSTYCWWAAFLSEASKIYISDKWLSPLITSCKSSICIPAEFYDTYKPVTVYKNPNTLTSFPQQLDIALNKFVVFSTQELNLLMETFFEMLYSFLAGNFQAKLFIVSINIKNLYPFEIHFNHDKSQLQRGCSCKPDLSFTFFDWQACANFFIFYQKDITALSNNRYMAGTGDMTIENLSRLKPAAEQKVILYKYIDNYMLRGHNLQFRVCIHLRETIEELLKTGKSVWILEAEQFDAPIEKISILFYANNNSNEIKKEIGNHLKIDEFKRSQHNDQVTEAISTEYVIESIERALRIFTTLPVDYLAINNYIIKNHYCNE